MMRCIIVDDEQLVRELLEDNIRQIPFLNLAGSCKNPLEANGILHAEQIDLVFLDIEMPRLNGLQFLELLDNPPLVIMVSAYEKYALAGFDLNVVDYVLKPFSFQRFLMACNRANELFKLKQLKNDPKKNNIPDFFVNVEYTLVKIIAQDIEYIEGLKDYIKIHLSGAPKPVLTRMTIKAIEEKLPAPAFIRTHKSFLVAAAKITSVKRDFVCIGKTEVPVSESYKENITRILNPGN
jgi:DNA-binding LytR/AlgR family response regulator